MLIGQLGADPELKSFADTRVALLSVATNQTWTDKSGQKQESTQWHRVKVFGPQADICETHLGKGDSVYVEGSIETRSYDDKQGLKRYITEIKAKSVQFLSPRREGAPRPGYDIPPARTQPAQGSYPQNGGEENIPF